MLGEKEPLGPRVMDVILLQMVDGIELKYQQVYVSPTTAALVHMLTAFTLRKDVITVLRCHHMEYCVQMSQSQWLDKPLRNNRTFVEPGKRDFLEGIKSRIYALSRMQKLTSNYVKSQLESHRYSSAERSLICQLLVDLETSFSAFTSDIGTKYRQGNSVFAAHQRDLAALLCESGDYDGALSLLHRIPLVQIVEKDLNEILRLGVALVSRMRVIPKTLGIDDDPVILDILESLDVLILPYSFLIIHSCQWINNDAFIKKSFMWPWIRRSIQGQLRDRPGKEVDWRPTRLDTQLRDAFGHTFLHAAIYSQDNEHILAIIKGLELGQEDARACLSTAWPSHAPGFTPLACSASSLGDREIFHTLLSFSRKNLCCESSTGTTSHEFCALAFAIRNHGTDVVKSLVQRSTQQMCDISNCCKWAMTWIPNIPCEIWGDLIEAGRRLKSSGDN